MDSTLKRVFRTISPILIYLIVERVVGICANVIYAINHFGDITVVTDDIKNQILLDIYEMQNRHVLLLSGIVALICIFIFKWMIQKEWAKRPYQIEMKPSVKKAYICVAAVSVGFTISFNLLINAWGIFKYDWDFAKVSRLIYSEPLVMQILVIGFIVPICEELLFRGIIYERISQTGKPFTAMMLTSVLFAFFHGTFIQIVYAFVFSCLLIYAYQKCGSFIAPLSFHIISNLSSLVLRQMSTLSTLGYSIGIVLFVMMGVLGLFLLKQDKFYRKVYA